VLTGLGCRAASATPTRPAVAEDLSESCCPAPVCPEIPAPPALAQSPEWPAIERIIQGPESEIDLAELNLLVARARDRTVNVQQNLLRVHYVAESVRQRFPSGCDDRCKIATLNQYLVVDQGYAAEFDPSGLYNKIDRDLLHRILDTRMGYCEGLTYLYL
jgi:hypothetical protein